MQLSIRGRVFVDPFVVPAAAADAVVEVLVKTGIGSHSAPVVVVVTVEQCALGRGTARFLVLGFAVVVVGVKVVLPAVGRNDEDAAVPLCLIWRGSNVGDRYVE